MKNGNRILTSSWEWSRTGFPISWPDGKFLERCAFSTTKGTNIASFNRKLLRQSRDVLQADLRSLLASHRELEQRETKIRRLVDANIIGIIIWTLDGRVLEANDAFLGMLGYERADLVSGRVRWTDLTPAEWRDSDARAVNEVKTTGIVQPFEKEFLSAKTAAACPSFSAWRRSTIDASRAWRSCST